MQVNIVDTYKYKHLKFRLLLSSCVSLSSMEKNCMYKGYTQKQSYRGKMYQKKINRSFTNADR